MTEPLFPYYERELLYLRKLVDEFAARHPVVAQRLQLETTRSTDAHVERLIETAALLSARVQRRLDDEFPQVTDALLAVLAPHLQAPTPSMAVAQFKLDPTRALGYVVPPGSSLRAPAVDEVRCTYRTAYPVSLWPLRLTSAAFQPPPFSAFPPGVAPAGSAAVLRLQFECEGPAKFAELKDFRALRLYLDGDDPLVGQLYEFLFNHALHVVFRPRSSASAGDPLLTAAPAACLHPVGFRREEGLLPYPPSVALGYRLLMEFFTFPAKFQFVDLGDWSRVARAGFERQCEVAVFLDRTHRRLEQGVSAATFRLGCTPVVNLFQPETLSITSDGAADYSLVLDEEAPHGYEVYSVDAVASKNPATGVATEYQPLFSLRHDAPPGVPYWYAEREPSVRANDRGTEIALHLVDLGLNPAPPREPVLQVRTTCTNRELPARLASEFLFDLEAAAPVSGIACVRAPTPPLRPPARRGRAWQSLAHLSLNHLALTDSPEGLEAFRDLLRLYQFTDQAAAEFASGGATQNLIEGVVGVRGRRVVGRVADEAGTGFGRGLEVALEFDEEKLHGAGVYLFAAVLERFLGQFVSANSFSQLVASTRQRGVLKAWPARPGQLPTL